MTVVAARRPADRHRLAPEILLSPIDTTEKAVALLAPMVAGRPDMLHAAFLDHDLTVIALRLLEWRADLTIEEHVRDVAREAMCFHASNVVVARRKQDSEPDELDEATRSCGPVMKAALAPFAIVLRDCLILTPDAHVSLADEGIL